MTDLTKFDLRQHATENDLEELLEVIEVARMRSDEYEEDVLAGFKSIQTTVESMEPLSDEALREDFATMLAKNAVVLSNDDAAALVELREIVLDLERCRLEEPGATEDPDRVDLSGLLELLNGMIGE
jgi:hypothetical protein